MTFILGGVQSDFARHLAREGKEIADLVGELVDGALADAQLDAGEVGTIHVGNAFGQLFTGQGQLGAMPATVRPALWGVPAARHDAACASGSIAILAAMAEIEADRYDVALVLGVEQERNVPGDQAAKFLGAAAWVGHEGATIDAARYPWPHMFSRIGDVYDERWGLKREHLVAIARKNLANARVNPLAQTRTWTIDDLDDATKNPVVEGRLRRYDCAQVTDGGAALVLASPRFAEGWAARRGRQLARTPRILGWGHRTAGLALEAKLERSKDGGLVCPHVAEAIDDARRRADRGLDAIDAYEIHDCFTTTEYLAIDHLGLTPPGESWRAIEAGRTAKTGDAPINPSGGLIGGGHPVGATGARMALDAARQTAGAAGATQVDGARTVQTLNLGGSATTVVSLIIGT